MPNHITNELTASKNILDSMIGPNGEVDFDTVIPMPDILKGESAEGMIEDWASIALGITTIASLSQRHEHPAEAFKRGDFGSASKALHQSNVIRMLQDGPYPKDFTDERFETLIRYMRALRKFGHANWYEWSIENWGTKWNAYDVKRVSETVVRFNTAWSAPTKIIAALAKKHPDEIIRLRWADEDNGANTGDVTVRGEDVIAGGRVENYSPQAWALCLDLKYDGVLPEDMRIGEGGKLEYLPDESVTSE